MAATASRLVFARGIRVNITGSGDPAKIALITEVLTPGARPMWAAGAVREADIVVLAVPLGNYRSLLVEALAGKLVIDAMNYWWQTDGHDEEFSAPGVSTSQIVQDFLPGSRVVNEPTLGGRIPHVCTHTRGDGA